MDENQRAHHAFAVFCCYNYVIANQTYRTYWSCGLFKVTLDFSNSLHINEIYRRLKVYEILNEYKIRIQIQLQQRFDPIAIGYK